MKRMTSNAGFGRTVLIALIALVAGALAGGYGIYTFGVPHVHEDEQGELYTCGMHPWIISDKPGDCPVCGMKLTRLEKGAAPVKADTPKAAREDDFFTEIGGEATAAKPAGKGRILFYRNPMNPEITSKVPAKDEMGMDYVPVYAEDGQGAETVGDRAPVRMDEDTIRRTGVATARAVTETMKLTARTVGRVVPDETAVRVVAPKVGGYVERLFVNYTGQKVRKGEPLLSVYSPELLSTQEEYLRAKKAAEKLSSSSDPAVRESAGELERLARRRLELFDVPESAIEELARTGKPQRAVILTAPISGYVTGKEIFEGTKIEPGMRLMTVTDLGRVWVEADIYEYEASKVRVGNVASLVASGVSSGVLTGKATFINPVLESETRTVKVRFEFPNPSLELKPGMFADVEVALESATGVTVPDSAVMDTGARRMVFIEREKGLFEPRLVEVGMRSGGRALLVSGVGEGEMVVSRANFLLDSESRLRAVISRITAGEGAK